MPNYQQFTDDQLLLSLCDGDHRAYTEIYTRYSGILYIHSYRRLRNREEAKDLIHELFATLWSKRAEISVQTKLSAYLYTSVKNRVIDLISRQKRQILYANSVEVSLKSQTDVTDHPIRLKELSQLIEKEIDALPEKMRQVFNLSRKSHLSHKEISEALDISEFTVRKQINNALKVLKPRLNRLLTLFL